MPHILPYHNVLLAVDTHDARTKRKRKKRNVDSKFPVFKTQCGIDSFVTTVDDRVLCLPRKDTVAVLEEYSTYNGIIR